MTACQLAELFLERIDRYDARLHAYLSVNRDAAVDAERTAAGYSLLRGMPLAVKDLVDVVGQPNTAASAVLAGNMAESDAEAIMNLRREGAVLLGKTNLHEFAYGGSGLVGSTDPARNPWNTAHITGGSSSGSAAAVAAGLCVAAIGSDTAGSIRLPASFCGIVGFKPTYGRVSVKGVIPLSVSFDHLGPMTRSGADARILFAAMAGIAAPSRRERRKLRIGVPRHYFFRELEPEVADATEDAICKLKVAGHDVRDVDFEVNEDRSLQMWESYQYHAKRAAESPELYQPETLRRIRTGAQVTEQVARDAKAKLETIRDTASEIFTDIDIVLTPTVPMVAPEREMLLAEPDTLRQRELLMLRNTRPFNVLGTPAISVPWDQSSDGMPIGIQFVAAPNHDFELLDFAEEVEELAPWQGRTPPEFS
ncbi:MAG TPA: amidase [Candidatus Koribacter sp.]